MANGFLSRRTFQAYNQVTKTPVSVTQAVVRYDTPSVDFVVRPHSDTLSMAVVGIGYCSEDEHDFVLKAGSAIQETDHFFAGQGFSYRLGPPIWVLPPGSDLIINLTFAQPAMRFWTCLFLPKDGPPVFG